MTIEELKAEAERMGYNLVPRYDRTKVKMLPCTCGRKRIECWYDQYRWKFYKCPICGKKAESAKTDNEARENWNRMVTNEL